MVFLKWQRAFLFFILHVMKPGGYILSIISFLSILQGYSQADPWAWWNKKHHYDGKKPQLEYIHRISSLMGPNAIPVPLIRDAEIGDEYFVKAGGDYYFSKHEMTVNPYFHVYCPVQKNRIAFEVYTRPIEYYETDTLTRDKRFARDSSAKGYSQGDVYVASRFNVWKELPGGIPAFTIDFMTKSTTGKNLENARHLNAPAYAAYGTLSRTVIKRDTVKLHAFFSSGGMFYQMYDNSQNDVFILGLGLRFECRKWTQNLVLARYSGYLGKGDNPMVLRYNIMYSAGRSSAWIQYQYGIQDFISNAFTLCYIYRFRMGGDH